jgi:predicted phage-related endonuclease
MAFESRQITNREQWLAWRREDITGTDAAALLGLHPYVSQLMLYLDKAGIVPRDDADTPRKRRGRLLEALGPELIKEARPYWEVIRAQDYVRDPVHRLGCTPDFFVRDNRQRFGINQFKSVEPGVFERNWRDPENHEISPPIWIGIQAALEKHLTGAAFATIGVVRVGHGIEFDLIELPETPGLIERLEAAADAFWQAIEKREPPPPDFLADAELVRRLYPRAMPDKSIDLTGNNRLPWLAAEDERLASIAKDADDRRRAVKAELLHLMGDAEFATVNGEIVASAKLIDKQPYQVTPKPYRDVRFRKKQEAP